MKNNNYTFNISSLFDGKVPLFLAPMAGVADRSARALCKRYGADFVTTEMVSAKAVHFGDKKTAKLAALDAGERPAAIQIFGSEPEIMAQAALSLYERFRPEAIDVNMGCPVPKVVKNGDGSALMRDPAKAGAIVRALVDALPCPVTVKIRAGWDDSSVNAPEFAKVLEANGAAAVCVHGRTRARMYAPPVDLGVIADTVKAVKIPVVGNGGIYTPDDARVMLERTGCAGVAVARGANGRPWIFAQIRAALDGRPWSPPSDGERIEAALEHLNMLIADKGEETGVKEARKHLAWYIHGMRGAASARVRINAAAGPEAVRAILYELAAAQ